MLSAEKQFILNCLSDYCNHRKTTEPAEQLNYGEVLKLAEEQSMAALIYYQCADWMNYGFLDNAFRKAVIQEGYFAVNRTYLFKELVTYMENKKIPFICMKGSVFKNSPTRQITESEEWDTLMFGRTLSLHFSEKVKSLVGRYLNTGMKHGKRYASLCPIL